MDPVYYIQQKTSFWIDSNNPKNQINENFFSTIVDLWKTNPGTRFNNEESALQNTKNDSNFFVYKIIKRINRESKSIKIRDIQGLFYLNAHGKTNYIENPKRRKSNSQH